MKIKLTKEQKLVKDEMRKAADALFTLAKITRRSALKMEVAIEKIEWLQNKKRGKRP